MKDSFNIQVKVSDLRTRLRKVVCSENADMITDILMGYIEQQESGLKDLFLALSGITREITFKPLDEVYIPIEKLPSWRMNIPSTIAAGLVHNGNFLKVEVVNVKKYQECPIEVKFTYMDKDNNRLEDTSWVPNDCLTIAEEPLLEEVDDDILPF